MRSRRLATVTILALLLFLPGCVGLSTSGAGNGAAGLGPDGPTSSETTVGESTSTLPQRMTAAATDLWSWYHALKSKVDPTIEPMKRLYVNAQELIVAVQGQDWITALGYASAAWSVVDELKGMVR